MTRDATSTGIVDICRARLQRAVTGRIGASIRPPIAGCDDMSTALVVDDDPDIVSLVAHKLEQAGFEVRQATNGEEALASVADAIPDVVLLDIMMPGISGLEALERWRAAASTARLPVLLLTAKSQEADVERGFELGADDYVIKPFSPNELVRRVNAVLMRSP
jgi:DNA-binding response OmpR family regulator